MANALNALLLIAEVTVILAYALCTSYGSDSINTGVTLADYEA